MHEPTNTAATGSRNAATPRQLERHRGEQVFPPLEEAIDGFDVDDDGFLNEEDSASRTATKPRHVPMARQSRVEPHEPEMIGRAAATPDRPKNAATAGVQSIGKMPSGGATTARKEAVRGNFQETAAAPTEAKPNYYVKSNKSSKTVANLSIPEGSSEQKQSDTEQLAAKSNRLFAKPSAPACAGTSPVVLTPALPDLPHEVAAKKKEPSATAMEFMEWLQRGLTSREIKYNETGAPVHFVDEGMALVSPLIFKLYAREIGPQEQADSTGMQVQREVIKSGWHRMATGSGKGKVNILRYQVVGRGNTVVARLSAVVLVDPDRFVLPVPPPNPVLKLESE